MEALHAGNNLCECQPPDVKAADTVSYFLGGREEKEKRLR